jgi:predicted porin
MNRKLLTLAVAAAVAAPTAAMAEAVLYGKLNVSIDYVDVTNVIGPTYDEVPVTIYGGNVETTETDTSLPWYSTSADALAGTGAIGDASDSYSFFNASDNSVFVPVYDDAGNVTGTQEVPANTGLVGGGLVTSSTSTGPDIEGITLIRTDAAGNPILDKTGAKDFNGWGINGRSSRGYMPGESRANRIGVKGSEDLGNGLKAIYQVEFGVQLADTNGNIASGGDNVTMRNSFVGLAGDFGTFLVGRHDTPLKISTGKLDLFSDTLADYNGTVGFQDLRTDNTVAYISPSFSGFSVALAAVAPGGSTDGLGANVNSDSFEAYSLAAIYNNGPFYASAAYESIGNEWFMDEGTSLGGKQACLNPNGTATLSCDYIDNDFSKWRLGLGLLDWNGFTLTAIYEQQDDIPAGQQYQTLGFVDPNGNVSFESSPLGEKEQRLWQVQAGYSFGNNMVKAMYGAVDRDADRVLNAFRTNPRSIGDLTDDLGGDRETWAIGFDHNFSKRTKVYALYTDVTDDQSDIPGFEGAEWSGFSLGMVHSF